MYIHFSVILLCFSVVYCIPLKISNLNLNELRQIYNEEIIMEEWETAMEQHIIYNENSLRKTVHVQRAVDEFFQEDNNDDETGFERIRNIIEIAYQCTLAKYANLTAYLIVQDVRTLKKNIEITVLQMTLKDISYDPENLFGNNSFHDYFPQVSRKDYHVDFDLRYKGRMIQLLGSHNFVSTPSKEWQNIWTDMIEKALGFKIKYKIYPEVFRNKFTNELDLPDVHILNEIDCVLNEVIQLFDNFILDKCIHHNGSFLDNFRSLRKGINNDLIRLTNYIDEEIADGSSYWALYKDFSIPGPGTSQANNEVMGSGGFVENVEFEISDLKMDLPNDKNPTEIYGHQDNERTFEIILRFDETMPNDENVRKVCLVKFRSPESLLDEQHTRFSNTVITKYLSNLNFTHYNYFDDDDDDDDDDDEE